MPYVIAAACIDVMDKSCVEECPVDCIYEGVRKLYINPVECIDCGACEPVCPVEAISQDRRVPDGQHDFVADNARFFSQPLPGRGEPLGAAGGASIIGALAVDTDLVTCYEVA
jgi:NAD-dependent dihydropyrimidine dehydrogenase PreA subunit